MSCEEELKVRVGMAKTSFWQNKELMRSNISMKTKLRLLDSYIFSVLNYGCKSWIWNKAKRNKIDAIEMWKTMIVNLLTEEDK